MDDLKLWVVFWKIAAVVLLSIIAGITVHNVSVTNAVKEMVANGTDPIAASCAVDFSERKAAVCALQVSK